MNLNIPHACKYGLYFSPVIRRKVRGKIASKTINNFQRIFFDDTVQYPKHLICMKELNLKIYCKIHSHSNFCENSTMLTCTLANNVLAEYQIIGQAHSQPNNHIFDSRKYSATLQATLWQQNTSFKSTLKEVCIQTAL